MLTDKQEFAPTLRIKDPKNPHRTIVSRTEDWFPARRTSSAVSPLLYVCKESLQVVIENYCRVLHINFELAGKMMHYPAWYADPDKDIIYLHCRASAGLRTNAWNEPMEKVLPILDYMPTIAFNCTPRRDFFDSLSLAFSAHMPRTLILVRGDPLNAQGETEAIPGAITFTELYSDADQAASIQEFDEWYQWTEFVTNIKNELNNPEYKKNPKMILPTVVEKDAVRGGKSFPFHPDTWMMRNLF